MANVADLLKEVEEVHKAYIEYAEGMEAYLFDPSSNPVPQIDEAKLKADDLLLHARNNKDSSVDMASGAISSVIFKVVSTVRELTTRRQRKAELYDMAVGYNGAVSAETRGESAKKASELRSTSPEQAEGT